MSTINQSNLDVILQNQINALTTATSFDDLLFLAYAIANKGDYKSTVANINLLPDITLGTTPVGTLIYVESIGQPVVAGNDIWFGLDGKLIRYDSSGQLWTWGHNYYGKLGDGFTANRSSPFTTSGGGINWSIVSAGKNSTAAIKTDGTLWTWGRNNYGQLGDNFATNKSSPVTTAGGGTTWSMVSAGGYCTAAIKTDGTLWTWGRNDYGRLGDNSTTARSSPGTTAGGGTTWSMVSAGEFHTVGIKTDGTLWNWGKNSYGHLGDNSTTSRSSPVTTSGGGTNWNIVSGGFNHTAAIKTDGTLWTWGYNQFGELGDNSITNKSSPVTTAGGGTTWSMVSAGKNSTAAIKTNGTLWTWGGKLGDIYTTYRSSPGTTTGGGTNWSMISSGGNHTAAIKTDGTLWTWGGNSYGQLGDGFAGAGTNRSSPFTTAGGGTSWSIVSAGDAHTVAISQL